MDPHLPLLNFFGLSMDYHLFLLSRIKEHHDQTRRNTEAVAVWIDATIFRSAPVPASMALLGKWNWYLPSWLSWLPDLNVEGPSHREAHTTSAVPAGSVAPAPLPTQGLADRPRSFPLSSAGIYLWIPASPLL